MKCASTDIGAPDFTISIIIPAQQERDTISPAPPGSLAFLNIASAKTKSWGIDLTCFAFFYILQMNNESVL